MKKKSRELHLSFFIFLLVGFCCVVYLGGLGSYMFFFCVGFNFCVTGSIQGVNASSHACLKCQLH